MKVAVIGASGKIGSAVAALLSSRHEVVAVSRHAGIPLDLERKESIEAFFGKIGPLDALVSCAGVNKFGPLARLSDEDFAISLSSKVMGQVNLVRVALGKLADRGSITLTSGAHPFVEGAAAALASGALEAFVEGAALEMPRGIRVNVVSPMAVKDPAGVARVYLSAVEGSMQGKTLAA